MKLRSRTTIAVTGATLAIAAGAGGALAAGVGGGTGPDRAPAGGVGILAGPGGGPAAVADDLRLTKSELRAQLKAGKSLAQIASAQGKSVAGLKDAMLADAKTRLDQAVADGKLTAAQEQTMLAELKSHLDDIVNRTGPAHAGVRDGGAPFGTAVTTYLGLTAAELRTQLRAGETLAQIAAAQGKSVDGLKAAILAGAKTRLDQAVTDGKLTAAQAATMLAELKSHIDDIVNRTGPTRKP